MKPQVDSTVCRLARVRILLAPGVAATVCSRHGTHTPSAGEPKKENRKRCQEPNRKRTEKGVRNRIQVTCHQEITRVGSTDCSGIVSGM